MMLSTLIHLVVLLRVSSWSSSFGADAAQLSIPQYDHDSTQENRQSEINAVAKAILNQPRFTVVAGVTYPVPPGPIPLDGSLAQRIAFQELGLINRNENPNARTIFGVAATANITSLDDYLPFYQRLENLNLIEVPITAKDSGDVAFGQDRLTIKGFRLRQVTTAMTTTRIPLSPEQLQGLCGSHSSLKDLIREKRLYVEDLSFASKYNDKSRPYKYVPSIEGYYCVNNEKKQFLPMAIHILDTKLVYTPYDDINEWKLAKMALNAAGVNVQAWDHFLHSHIMIEPIRVELLRSMSARHPVYVLMEHHFLQLFGNQLLGIQALLSANTTLDLTFGWGASGTLRFIYDESLKFDFTKQFFIRQIRTNGLDNIPNAKLFKDSQDVYDAIKAFVRDFVTLYYSPPARRQLKEHGKSGRVLRGYVTEKTVGKKDETGNINSSSTSKAARPSSPKTDAAVAADEELQNWMAASSKVVQGFPSTVTTVDGLVDTLSNLIFRTSVQHHAMNSDVVWHGSSFPYSLPSLFAPLPTEKGRMSNVLADFVVPRTLFPQLIVQFVAFYRPIAPAISILQSYDTAEFNITARKAITTYQSRLTKIEAKIVAREKKSKRPYTFFKPSRLPHYVWI